MWREASYARINALDELKCVASSASLSSCRSLRVDLSSSTISCPFSFLDWARSDRSGWPSHYRIVTQWCCLEPEPLGLLRVSYFLRLSSDLIIILCHLRNSMTRNKIHGADDTVRPSLVYDEVSGSVDRNEFTTVRVQFNLLACLAFCTCNLCPVGHIRPSSIHGMGYLSKVATWFPVIL